MVRPARFARTLALVSVCLSGALGLSEAAAQDASVAADRAYEEGTRLLQAGELERACPRLAESHRLDPSPGALLALARCHEKAGRLATAWSTYTEAGELARQRGDAVREAAARNQIAQLAPRLPRLTIRLHPEWSGARDLRIRRNDVAVAPGEIGTPLAVDPGVVVIEVQAAGMAPTRLEVEAREGEQQDAAIPAPARLAAEVAPPDRSEPVSGSSSGPPVASWIAGGVGVVGLGVFAGFGIASASAASDVDAQCPDQRCPASLRDTVDAGARNQVIANVGLGVGLAGIATAAVLWIVWPEETPAAAAIAPAPAPGDGLGTSVRLRF